MARLKGLLTPPRDLLGRIRWLLLLASLATAASIAPLLVIAPASGGPSSFAAATALVLLAWRWVRQYEQAGTAPVWEATQVLSLLLVIVAVGPNSANGMFSLSLCFGSLYGSGRGAAVRTLLYVGAYLCAAVLSPHQKGLVAESLIHIPGLVMSAALVYFAGMSLTRHERALARERLLRTTGSALEAAVDRAAILATAAGALRTLLEGIPRTRIYIALGSEDELTVVVAEGEGATSLLGRTFDRAGIPEPVRASPVAGQTVDIAGSTAAFLGELGIKGGPGALLMHPVLLKGRSMGTIAIMSDSCCPEEIKDALAMLSSQIALALESMTLAEDLRRSEERFRSLVQHSSDIVTVLAADTAIQYQSPSIERICGYDPAELVGRAFPELIHEADVQEARAYFDALVAHPGATATIEWRFRHRQGSWLYLETIGTNLLGDPSVQGIVLNSRDISVRKQLEEQLLQQALRDPLTGLPNHRALIGALDAELERSHRFNRPCAVLFLDLDRFKALNDGYGHQAGDAALHAFGEVARSTLRAVDTLGRWGGEEFVALLPETELTEALAVAERVREAVAAQTLEACGGAYLTCSIGVAIYPGDARDVDSLVAAADRAMYAAKGLGRNQVRSAGDPAVAALEDVTNAIGSRQDATLRDTVEALAALVEARDRYSGAHAHQVAALSRRLALALGLDATGVDTVEIAGRLHDVGKGGVPDAVLRKPGGLSASEWELLRGHAAVGAEVVGRVPGLRAVAPIIRGHHERWDGRGYPDGLAGEAIPHGARIVAVADAYSAMTTDRPYRRACPTGQALAELWSKAGTQFDPAVVRMFAHLLGADEQQASLAEEQQASLAAGGPGSRRG